MTVRPFEPADLASVLSLLEAALPADPISTARFTRQVLLDANFRAEGALVGEDGGQIVGFCLAMARQVPMENAPPDDDRGYITLMAIHPEFQRQGIGTRLLAAAEDYLRSQGRRLALVSPYAPGYFIPGVDVEHYPEGLSFFQKQGYTELYRAIAMETSLWTVDIPAWIVERRESLSSEGVIVEEYRPELSLPLLDFARQEFPGDWVRVVRETMARILGGDPPGRIQVAHQQGRVLGFVQYENERFGPIGVGASERGRGIGQVLMFSALRSMRQQGFRTAWFLWSDERTARRLYDSAGFRVVRRFAILRKEL